jgi:hypothetical protein
LTRARRTDACPSDQIVELGHLQHREIPEPLVRRLVAGAVQVADLLEREPDLG